MKIFIKTSCIIMAVCLTLAGCTKPDTVRMAEQRVPDILQIHADGKMVFNDRIMPVDDVIIYPDGFGGEKAAVKLYTPYHPPFYRDSIIVDRLEPKN